MKFFGNPRNYALATGILLFGIGLYGFAFRGHSGLSDGYLVLAILLGFWGILVGIKGNH